jgi:hypothetical protein
MKISQEPVASSSKADIHNGINKEWKHQCRILIFHSDKVTNDIQKPFQILMCASLKSEH